MKVALSAYSVSVGMYLSVGGLGGMWARTSLSAASRQHTNRIGDKESPWGLPMVVSKGLPVFLSICTTSGQQYHSPRILIYDGIHDRE